MNSNVDDARDEVAPDILTMLARLEGSHPEVAAASLAREVLSLLGRPTQPAIEVRPAEPPASRSRRTSKGSAFAWYQILVSAFPPVMSPEDTVTAARAVEAGLFAEERLAAEDAAYFPQARVGDLRVVAERGREAFRLLVVSNLRLVFHWTKGVAASLGEDWAQDAFQSGCIGLMRGIQGWDYTRGYALSTYVSWHIRQQVQRWRWNEVSLIRLPVHVWESLASESPSLSEAVVMAALRAQEVIPIEDLDEDDAAILWDGGLEEVARGLSQRRAVAGLLKSLTGREALVLELRYGLGRFSSGPLTLDAIGQSLGVTRERIRQIEAKALEKLQKNQLALGAADTL